jgi:hypothetical protein
MLDEIFELFDRKKGDRPRQGGLRGIVGRLTGDDDDRRDRRADRSQYPDDDDDGYGRDERRDRRRSEGFDFD